MEKISGNAKANVEFTIKFSLTKGEAEALEAIVGYGSDVFLEHFYAKLGKSYLQPREKDLRSLFTRIQSDLPKEIQKISNAELAISEALESFK